MRTFPLQGLGLSDANGSLPPNCIGGRSTCSHLALGFPEEHLIGAPESFSEGPRRVCAQLRLASCVGVYVHSSVPRSIHSSVTVEHCKVGAVHRVLVGNTVGVTARLASRLTEAVTQPEALIRRCRKGQEGPGRISLAPATGQPSSVSDPLLHRAAGNKSCQAAPSASDRAGLSNHKCR